MRRLVTYATASALLGTLLIASPSAPAAPPDAEVVVTGVGVQVYPAYDESVSRFAIRTTPATAGEVQVSVENASTTSQVRINGVPATSGTVRTVRGLEAGDEINVQVSDGVDTLNQSWVYLPDGFPQIDTTSSGVGPAPGMTALTLRYREEDSYPTIVDRFGVPVYVGRDELGTSDLNRQPNGHYSLAVALDEDLWGDYVIEEYDEAFRKVGTHQMIGHPKTDFHDTILLPGGGRILMAYIKAPDGQTDSWLQEVAPDGRILLDWNSRDHVDRLADPIENALGDYAHLNSMQVMRDGNLLLSFRHLNQVMKIDRATGDVIWRLGGRVTDEPSSVGQFTFVDDPSGGPCAQHTARELANGDIQIFDNGSGPAPFASNPLCPNPSQPQDPYADPVYRAHSRVTVYHLDESTLEARMVESTEVGAFSQFAGSSQRLGANTVDDHLFVGLNNGVQLDPPAYGTGEAPDAIEFGPDGSVVWTLTAQGSSTYRAQKIEAPDRIAPEITITSPAEGTQVERGTPLVASFTCSDRGGSNLAGCDGNAAQGASLSSEVGTHQLVVRGTDGNGNAATRTVTYTVTAPATAPDTPPVATPPPANPVARADAMIRKPRGRWKTYGVAPVSSQTVTFRAHRRGPVVAHVKVRNEGDAAARLTLTGLFSDRRATGQWYDGDREVTGGVLAGTYRTKRLAPGESTRLRLVVRIPSRLSAGRQVVRLAAQAPLSDTRDVVRARIRVR